jgi:hypothetical protein
MVAVEIHPDAEFGPTDSTQYRGLVEPIAGPPLGVVVDTGLVTSKTGIIGLTTGKPDGDDIAVAAVVGTSSLVADSDTDDEVVVWRQSASSAIAPHPAAVRAANK